MTSIKPKGTLQLFRDCLRLIKHVAGSSAKADHLRRIARAEFEKNRYLTDPQQMHEAKQHAERVLSNYFLFEHLQHDPKLAEVRDTHWKETEIKDEEFQRAEAERSSGGTVVDAEFTPLDSSTS